MSRVLVIYQSFSGSTQKMAEAVAAGAREVRDVEVGRKGLGGGIGGSELCLRVRLRSPKHVRRHVGRASRLLRSGLERARAVAGRPAVAFSSENAGVTPARQEIEKFFTFYKLRKLSEGVTAVQSPGPKELEACKALGRELAKAALHYTGQAR